MGNQPSSPTQTSAPPLPPPPPPCDLNCQKDKDLALLKTALDNADKDTDPVGYEKARIAYYTLLNGQGWLNTEKQRIAKDEVEPVVSSYNSKYSALKGEQQSQSVFVNLANNLKAQQASGIEDNAFLQKQLSKDKDRADVLKRLSSFSTPSFSYIPIIIDIIIGILMIAVLYLGFTKVDRIRSFFVSSTDSIDGSIT
uniref:Uncharacterized protein n=1 Tax=viral metagenome TaxID=1070528 RepID=A0A6C0JQ63_9ZZZZ